MTGHKSVSRKRRWFLSAVAVAVVIGLLGAGYFIRDMGYRLTGYAAKQTCSLVFVSQQPLETVLVELQEDNPYIKYVDVELNLQEPGTIASIAGWFENRAVYRFPVGATLVFPEYETALKDFPIPKIPEQSSADVNKTAFVPIGAANVNLLNQLNTDALSRALTYAFAEPDHGESHRRTRAVFVVWKDHVIAEKYHPDFRADSLLLGWSMSKSITNLLIGRRIQQGGDLSLAATGLRPEWLKDDRKNISLEDLLRMQSGLKFEEAYSPMADVLTMLYRRADMGAFAASFNKVSASDAVWHYSSGTSNILSQQLRRSFDNDRAYVQFIWEDLLLPLGIRTAQLEFDASGTWVGSSYTYATALDWARIGKLVLNKGRWEGQQLLPADWIARSAIPTASYRANPITGDPPGKSYGMHWWLNRKDSDGKNWLTSVPEDAIIASGHFGQYVAVIPSRELIVVRLGLSKGPQGWNLNAFLGPILEALPQR